MISYMDKTFCNSDCLNQKCTRKLTPEIVNDAAEWWGNENAPIAVSNFTTTCESYIGKDYEQED
jgi:hypothetical protein